MATKNNTTSLSIAEMREFAGFSPCEQRFIRRNLDIGLGRCDAFKLWARNAGENVDIRRQYVAYQDLKVLRHTMPGADAGESVSPFMGQLSRLAAFDLAQERLDGFSPFRFLYERLLGPAPPCRTCAPHAASCCCKASAKLPRPRLHGPRARRPSSPNMSIWQTRPPEPDHSLRAARH